MSMRWIKNGLKFSVICATLSLGSVSAQLEGSSGGFDIGSMIKQMKLNKGDLARMIDQLVQTGQIKPEEAKAAKAKLLEMNDSDMEKLKIDAVELYNNKGGDTTKLMDEKTRKAYEELKSNGGESELSKKIRMLDEGY